ncbi:MAG: 6,7-dimethyl-8-ribityllumazine synthase [Phycisphaerales bacterium]
MPHSPATTPDEPAVPVTPPNHIQGDLIADNSVKIAIVVARFNEFITKHLLDGAVDTWARLCGGAEALTTVWVPGSFELPVTAKKLAESGQYRAVICLGCVIRGETDHYDHVVEQTAKGIKDVGVMTGVPCIFGVLTCDTVEQAVNRAGLKMGNAGRSAMMAGIEMADLIKKLEA